MGPHAEQGVEVLSLCGWLLGLARRLCFVTCDLFDNNIVRLIFTYELWSNKIEQYESDYGICNPGRYMLQILIFRVGGPGSVAILIFKLHVIRQSAEKSLSEWCMRRPRIWCGCGD